MPVTKYITVNGQLTGEITNGVRTQYMTDALGSVIGTTDGSGNVLNTYRYTPYGGRTYKTGTSPDPKFLFAGTWGGRQTGRSHSEEYWRARHRSEPETTWTTVDYFWPRESPYTFALQNPILNVDASGNCVGGGRCLPSLSVSVVGSSCEVIDFGAYLYVKIFKYIDYRCDLRCQGPSCSGCMMTQFVSDSLRVRGQLVDGYNGFDWIVGGPCPGSLTRTDAPGKHSGRSDGSQGPDQIGFAKFPAILPAVYNGLYIVNCTCGNNSVATVFTYNWSLTIDSKGRVKCSSSLFFF